MDGDVHMGERFAYECYQDFDIGDGQGDQFHYEAISSPSSSFLFPFLSPRTG